MGRTNSKKDLLTNSVDTELEDTKPQNIEGADAANVFEVCAAIAGASGLAIGIILSNDVNSLFTPWLTLVVIFFLSFPFWWRFPETAFWRRLPRITIRLILATVFLLAVAGCSYWEYYLVYRVPIAADMSRQLVPAADPYMKDECAENVPAGSLLVYFGNSTAFIPADPQYLDNRSAVPLLVTANTPILTVEKSPVGIYLTADVMSRDGQFVVKMVRNKFLNSPNNSLYQVRSDKSTIAVYDEHDEEVFYARYMNSFAIKIRGTFGYPGKHTLIITDTEMIIPALNQHIPRMCIGSIVGGYRF